MKPLFVISCPIDTYSGYGARSRDLVKSIIELDRYNVKVLSQRWGDCPWGFIDDHEEWAFIKPHLLAGSQLPKKPEIWAQITVPNEFQAMGKYNIGFTAGIESTIAIPEWIEGSNRMDLLVVSSNHSAEVFKNSTFKKVDKETQQEHGELKLEIPVEVLLEGVDLDIYKPLDTPMENDTLFKSIDSIPEKFSYLFVGHWMTGNLGEDRKNVGLLIKSFLETFKNKKKKPALILKTSGAGSSYMDRDAIIKKLETIKATVNSTNLPNIYLLHGEFSDSEMNEIYNHSKVKAMINLTKGEGFGRPLLEFSLSKKPIIVSNWSGHMDFLNPDFVCALNGELKNVHESAANTFLIKDSQWFSPDHGQIGFYLKDVFENYKKYEVNAKRQAHKSKTEFSFGKMTETIGNYLERYTPEFPVEAKLKLPTIKKIELPKLKKV